MKFRLVRGRVDWSVGGIAGHGVLDGAGEGVGDLVPLQVGHRVVGDAQELRDHLFAAVAFECGMAGGRAEQGGAEAVEIRRHARRLPAQQFRGGKSRGAGDGAAGGVEAADHLCDAEIRQLRLAVLGDEDVGGFDVAVQDIGGMCSADCAGDPNPEVGDLAPVEGAAAADLGVERVEWVVLHHQVRPSGPGGADLQDRDDVGMHGQPAHGALLAQEPLPARVVEGAGEDLDRDRAVEFGLAAAVYGAEAALADEFRFGEPLGLQFGGGVLRAGNTLGRQRIVHVHRPTPILGASRWAPGWHRFGAASLSRRGRSLRAGGAWSRRAASVHVARVAACARCTEAARRRYTRSNTAARPCPPPMHMVSRP